MQYQSERLDAVSEDAVKALRSFFKQDDFTTKDIGRAKVAATVVSTWGRILQTENAKEATILMLAREVATTKDQLRDILERIVPESDLIKALL